MRLPGAGGSRHVRRQPQPPPAGMPVPRQRRDVRKTKNLVRAFVVHAFDFPVGDSARRHLRKTAPTSKAQHLGLDGSSPDDQTAAGPPPSPRLPRPLAQPICARHQTRPGRRLRTNPRTCAPCVRGSAPRKAGGASPLKTPAEERVPGSPRRRDLLKDFVG